MDPTGLLVLAARIVLLLTGLLLPGALLARTLGVPVTIALAVAARGGAGPASPTW